MARTIFDLAGKSVFVAGHRGMVGAAIVRRLGGVNCEILTADRATLDLLSQSETQGYLASVRPDVVIVAAAKVGGIHANSAFPADFIYENIVIAANIIHGAFKAGVNKLFSAPPASTHG